MNKLSSFLLCAAVAVCPLAAKSKGGSTLQPVNLGSASTFAVFGNTGVTNAGGATTITGNLGSSIPSVTGFKELAGSGSDLDTGEGGPGIVIGTIDDTDNSSETNAAAHAAAALGIAITDAKGRKCPAGQSISCTLPYSELTLDGTPTGTFTSGVYTFADVATITGPLTLSGPGVFIFQLGTLTVNPTGKIVLAGGATAANVFWVTTATTLNSIEAFAGNILATTFVHFTNTTGGTVLTGRALAQTDVTFAATDYVTLPK